LVEQYHNVRIVALLLIAFDERGFEALRQGDPARAEILLREAARREPNDLAVAKALGMALAAQEKYSAAEPWFGRVCAVAPREPDACYYWGRALFTLGRLDDAIPAFRKALDSGGRPGRTWHGLALALDRLGRSKEAEAAYRKAIELKESAAAPDYERFRRENAAATASSAKPVRFRTIPLTHITRNGAAGRRHLPETMIAGAAILDFDNDGRLDIFLPNGAALPDLEKRTPEFANRLFRNRGGETFEDVTATAGLAGKGYSMGAAAGDYDGDGRVDLFVPGVNASRLYRNLGGRFEDVTVAAGLPESSPWSVAAAWLDFDGDGRLDLFVARYVQWDPGREPVCENGGRQTYCHPKHYAGLANALYRNVGGGRFADVSVASGIARYVGKAMAATAHDFDGDGRIDLFVANDTLPNFLFRNLGAGKFAEVAVEAGVALKEDGVAVSSMGGAVADFDGDGHADLLVPALSDETFPFFRGLGGGRFADATARSRIAVLSRPYTGWNVAAADFNRDGSVDFAVAGGHVQDNAERYSSRASKQPILLFLNRGDGTFDRQEIGEPAFHRGLVAADLNGDGWPDLAVTRLNQPSIALLNLR
jgi:tetratricopeptide (TPR) repeat protein